MQFVPVAEHVRTARLVAVSAARRAGLDEARLDEVRLAVGEVCARAVGRSKRAQTREPLELRMDDAADAYEVRVTDHVGAEDGEAERVALALARGMADLVEVTDGPGGAGGIVCLTWFSTGRGRAPDAAV